MPSHLECQEIFSLHLLKRNRKPSLFNLEELAKASEGYSGADIEQTIKLGLKIAFANDEQLRMEHIQKAILEIIPLSQSEGDRITKIRQWGARHAKLANPQKGNTAHKINCRKVSLN